MAHIIATLRIVIGTAGLFFGYYELFDNKLEDALNTVTITSVGMVGLLSYDGHPLHQGYCLSYPLPHI